MMFKRTTIIVGMIILASFIGTSAPVYDADISVSYNLVFTANGTSSHYNVVLSEAPGYMNITYFYQNHTMLVNTTNIEELTIDAQSLFADEVSRVSHYSAYIDSNIYDFLVRNGVFTLISCTDQSVDFTVTGVPKPGAIYEGGTEHVFSYDMGTIETICPQGDKTFKIHFGNTPYRNAPTSKISVSPSRFVTSTDTVTISGLSSVGVLLSYQWKIDGAYVSTNSYFSTTLATGVHEIELEVLDSHGLYDLSMEYIYVDTMPTTFQVSLDVDEWNIIGVPYGQIDAKLSDIGQGRGVVLRETHESTYKDYNPILPDNFDYQVVPGQAYYVFSDVDHMNITVIGNITDTYLHDGWNFVCWNQSINATHLINTTSIQKITVLDNGSYIDIFPPYTTYEYYIEIGKGFYAFV